MAIIYKIVNDMTDKVYIGKTTYGIQKRWKEHINDSQKEKNQNRPLYFAMNQYGIEHFFIEPIENCSDDIAESREIYWIEQYNSLYDGYNATYGGGGKSYINKELVLQMWFEGKTVKEICDVTGYSNDGVADFLHKNGISAKETKYRGYKNTSSPVLMYDLNGKYIKEFPSVGEAAFALTGQRKGYHISEVCRGKRKIAYGYTWKFKETE